jgi:trk system potassium uptake protein TrkA
VGSELAVALEKSGHTVAVIDKNPRAFRRLAPNFTGRTVVGFGFDRDHLAEAGIEQADALAAVTNGDNSNILTARIARENYGIEHVVARIYDPRRALIYQRLGIPTVATVRWTADQMLRRLLPEGSEPLWRDPTGAVVLAEVAYAADWVGEKTTALEEAARVRAAFLSRLGEVVLPGPGTVLQEGDVLHVIALEEDLERISAALSARAPGGKAKGGR